MSSIRIGSRTHLVYRSLFAWLCPKSTILSLSLGSLMSGLCGVLVNWLPKAKPRFLALTDVDTPTMPKVRSLSTELETLRISSQQPGRSLYSNHWERWLTSHPTILALPSMWNGGLGYVRKQSVDTFTQQMFIQAFQRSNGEEHTSPVSTRS